MGILLMYALLGMLCGALGGIWIQKHKYVVGALKRWRLKSIVGPADTTGAAPARRVRGSLYDALLEPTQRRFSFRAPRASLSETWNSNRHSISQSFRKVANKTPAWKDLLQISITVVVNTVLAALLPLLGGKPQPLLLSTLFDKNLVVDDSWVFTSIGPLATMFLC